MPLPKKPKTGGNVPAFPVHQEPQFNQYEAPQYETQQPEYGYEGTQEPQFNAPTNVPQYQMPQQPEYDYSQYQQQPSFVPSQEELDSVIPDSDGDGDYETVSAQESSPVYTEYPEDEEEEIFDLEKRLADLPNQQARDSVNLLLEELLSDESSEVIMNGHKSIHCKRNGQRVHLTAIKFDSIDLYHKVINDFILEFADTQDRLNATKTLIEGQLEMSDGTDEPMIARVHILAPPAVKEAQVTIAKKARRQLTLDDIANNGAMSDNMLQFLKTVARGKLTTVISGLSGSGKTTLLEAMSHYFDKDDRVIIAEDTPELKLPLPDVVSMVSMKPKPGEPNSYSISLEWLVQQANRMRPDRIIVGETRGAEMSEFLIAANSGADGSMTTLHAHDPERAWRKMVSLAAKAGNGSRSEDSILRDVAGTVHIIIQAGLIDGRHIIKEITEVSGTIIKSSNTIAMTTLFEYDQKLGTWTSPGRPSEELVSFLKNRNAPYDPTWFNR